MHDGDLECVAGFPPGPLHDEPQSPTPPQHSRPSSPTRPTHRANARFTTDAELIATANVVTLTPERDRAVFYCEDEGKRLAADFVARHAGHTRLDELLQQTQQGRRLWASLVAPRPWSDNEEVWWVLSRRLAAAAAGVVHAFGPARLTHDVPVQAHRHAYPVRAADGTLRNTYANTVFEKVEWPELEQNPAVTVVYYNGVEFRGDEAGDDEA